MTAKDASSVESHPAPGPDGLAVMFLNLGFGRERTGIENAALLRARLFERHLKIVPTLLTCNYDAHFSEVRAELIDHNQISENTIFRNLYDELQEIDASAFLLPNPSTGGCLVSAATAAGFIEKPVVGTPDWRVYDQGGRCVQYRKYSPYTGILQYVNFLHHGKRWRRDTFTPTGALSRIQYIDPASGESLFEQYLRPDGTVAIAQLYTLQGTQRQLARISLLDRKGRFTNEFETQEQCVTFWLNRLTDHREQKFLMICDKSRVFYRSLVDLKHGGRKEHMIVVPVIHAVHTKNGFAIETSGTNVNYADILHSINTPDAVVVGTRKQREDIVQRYGNGNIHVIPPACRVACDESNVAFSSRRKLEIVYVARYSEEKNHQLAIHAFTRVVDAIPGSTLQLYGSGPQKNQLCQMVEELGLQDSVFVNGYAEDVASVFRHAGLSILASQGEGYSLVIMESLSYGCPVVAFDVRYGPADTITHGVSGALVPFGDTEALADQIIAILTDAALHRQMCENACEAAKRSRPGHVASLWGKLIEDFFFSRNLPSGG